MNHLSIVQAVAWSKNNPNTEKDRAYIINQILAYGTIEELRWLYKTYSKKTLKDVFLNQPIKQYTPASINFARLLLDIVNPIDLHRYDKTLPRRIG